MFNPNEPLQIAITQGDMQALVSVDPLVALKLENVALKRLLIEARTELARLSGRGSPDGVPAALPSV